MTKPASSESPLRIPGLFEPGSEITIDLARIGACAADVRRLPALLAVMAKHMARAVPEEVDPAPLRNTTEAVAILPLPEAVEPIAIMPDPFPPVQQSEHYHAIMPAPEVARRRTRPVFRPRRQEFDSRTGNAGPVLPPVDHCPTCNSHSPDLHPAMQHEGEVQVCPDPFHGAAPASEGTVAACPPQCVCPRCALGRRVREVWITWARQQPNPKPSWLVEWEWLAEPDREVDRQIGEAIWFTGIDLSDEYRARQVLSQLGWEWEAFEKHLDVCSPRALRRALELLAPDSGDERMEQLSRAAEKVIRARLAALSSTSTPPSPSAVPESTEIALSHAVVRAAWECARQEPYTHRTGPRWAALFTALNEYRNKSGACLQDLSILNTSGAPEDQTEAAQEGVAEETPLEKAVREREWFKSVCLTGDYSAIRRAECTECGMQSPCPYHREQQRLLDAASPAEIEAIRLRLRLRAEEDLASLRIENERLRRVVSAMLTALGNGSAVAEDLVSVEFLEQAPIEVALVIGEWQKKLATAQAELAAVTAQQDKLALVLESETGLNPNEVLDPDWKPRVRSAAGATDARATGEAHTTCDGCGSLMIRCWYCYKCGARWSTSSEIEAFSTAAGPDWRPPKPREWTEAERVAMATALREVHLTLERWDAEEGKLGFGTVPFGDCSPELCGQYMLGADRLLAILTPREPGELVQAVNELLDCCDWSNFFEPQRIRKLRAALVATPANAEGDE